MTELTQSLDRILAWLQQNDPESASGFSPGLSNEEISKKLQELPFKVSREVYELYQWSSGDTKYGGVFVYHWLMPLHQALEDEKGLNEEEMLAMRRECGEPQYLFPLFEFDGEFFVLIGQAKSSDTAPIFHISDCCEVSSKPVFNSLAGMMKALAECYETGVYSVDPDPDLGPEVTNEEQFGKIRHKHNPGTVKQLYAGGW